ncbi:hypothetical protein OZX56_05130 [Lactobacillus sp. ESL0684]|uniref:hypothetical protein n=1 Tax=Lactobacillus sp. ESL0684 TaxID=2983213 RepID=UPI0023F928DA|nr:hypothetical protein [Lactobacillus sp. ESL0684]WEV42933.1 hypothetical protein OZX56_05130 [Lactobacillus sp. ESL0684]
MAEDDALKMNDIKSLEQFKDLIDTGYEIEFILNNKHWLLEPDQDETDFSPKRELASDDNVKKFNNTDEVLKYQIDGQRLADSWSKITKIE